MIFVVIINIVLIIGCLVAGTTNWRPFYRTDDAYIALWFVPSAIAMIPFVVTYTRIGLNPPETTGDPDYQKAKDNLRKVKKVFPQWSLYFNAPYILIGVFWLFLHNHFNPFFTFCIGINLFSIIWFLKLYPIAKKALAPKQREES